MFTVNVTQQVFASASQQADFLSTLSTTASGLSSTAAVALVTSAAAMLNDPTSPLNGDALAAASVRASLLGTVAAAATSAATPVALQSAASAVASLVQNQAQVSAAGAAAALGVLSSVSSAGTDRGVAVSNATSFAVAAGLSSIAGAALAPGSTVGTGVLAAVSGVVDALAGSQLAALSVPGEPPVEVTSAAIQMRVSLDVADAGGRLFTAPLTAPDSQSAFSPMPPGIFGSSTTPVRTQFAFLAFDPFTPNATGGTGVTRLVFTDASGAEVPVQGLSTPIYFTLPAVAGLAASEHAQCQFWSESAGAYDTAGWCARALHRRAGARAVFLTRCTVASHSVGLPNPQPPGHEVSWAPGFSAANDAAMAGSWLITGPLVDAACAPRMLDCTAAEPGVIFPNPAAPLLVPGVTCNASLSTAPMVVFVGSQCKLIQANNNLSCAWDNSKQAFTGAGCVARAGPTECACRHLTNFAGVRKPSIPVCSLQDLLSLKPGDIVSKLKMLFTVVIVLFGIMNLGATLGFYLDARERRSVVARLQQADTGFRISPDVEQCWLWRFHLSPLREEMDAPSGSAVVLSNVLGIPFARLRAALPDELLSEDMGSAIGRKHVFSIIGMAACLPKHSKLTESMGLRRSKDAAPGLDRMDTGCTDTSATTDASPKATPEQEKLEELVRLSSPRVPCAARVCSPPRAPRPAGWHRPGARLPAGGSAGARDRAGAAPLGGGALLRRHHDARGALHAIAAAPLECANALPQGWDFVWTFTAFLTLLMPGVLNLRHRWLVRARLWKLILAQRTDGSWNASSTVAFSLEAREASETAGIKSTLLQRVTDALGGAVEAEDGMEMAENVMHAFHGSNGSPHSPHGATDEAASPKWPADTSSGGSGVEHNDCPLTCSASAIAGSMPSRLARVQAADESVDVLRVWTTMCCIAVLEHLTVSWLWGDGDMCVPRFARAPSARRLDAPPAAPPLCAATPRRSARWWTPGASGSSATRRSSRRSRLRWRTARWSAARTASPPCGTARAKSAWRSCAAARPSARR